MEYTPEDIAKKIGTLPDEIQDMIFDPSIGEKIQAIGKKNNLHVDQVGILMAETNLVMIGLTHPDQFIPRIKEGLSIADEAARAIADDISAQVVMGVRLKLMELEKEKEQPDETRISDEEIEKILNENIEIGNTQNVMEKSGVEVIENKPLDMGSFGTVTVAAMDKNLEKSGVEVMPEKKQTEAPAPFHLNRDIILKGVENPPVLALTPAPADELKKGIVGEKLAGTFKIAKEEKEYSLKKAPISQSPAVDEPILRHKDRVDPYRESI